MPRKSDLNKDELAEIRNELAKQAEIQKKIAESAGDYLKLIKDIKSLHKDIANTERLLAAQQEKVTKAEKALVGLKGDELEKAEKILSIEKEKLKILSKEVTTMKEYTAQLTQAGKETSKLQKSMAVFKDVKKDLTSIYGLVNKGYGKLESTFNLFSMDKSLKMSALQMGILSKQTDGFRNTLSSAANSTIDFGVGIEELAKLQASYSEELGRTVTFTEQGAKSMAAMSIATGLGADGAAKLAADMENFGYSVERTAEFVEQTMNDSHKMGLNAAKVVKTLASNMKMLNKYNFKGGAKGLAKMAETVTKLGVDMNIVAGMADKLFDIEGAVDMSAQLQVMGGAWAKLADPFKLMYMARNDMEGLIESVGEAAAASAKFNAKTKEFEISAMEMHRLRKVAEQTGVAYEDLAQAGKNAARYTKVKTQMRFSVDKATQEFIANTAQFNERGEATLNINGSPKLLKDIDKATLKAQMDEKASLEERAKQSQTFDETLGNLVKQFKQLLLPLVTELDTVVAKFSEALRDPKVIGAITDTAKMIGKTIGVVGKFIANNPMTALAGLGLFEAGKWFLNGMSLGKGFNITANVSGSGGGMLSNLFKGKGMMGKLGGLGSEAGMFGKFGKMGGGMGFGGSLAKGLKAGGGLGIASLLMEGGRGMMDDPDSDLGKTIGIGGTAAGWAGTGAMIGSVIPGLGTAAGGIIGGIAGAGKGIYDEYFSDEAEKKKATVSGMHDGIFGSDFSKGRGVIQGGTITPIDNKDSLMAMKPNGPIDKVISEPKSMKIEFGDIHFKFDELKVTSPGSPGVAIDLLKDPQFIRSITRMVHSETEKVIQGGKPKG